MIRRPPRSTLDRSSAASDVYKRQHRAHAIAADVTLFARTETHDHETAVTTDDLRIGASRTGDLAALAPVSYTHLRAHETVLDLVCRLLLEKKNHNNAKARTSIKNLTTITIYH